MVRPANGIELRLPAPTRPDSQISDSVVPLSRSAYFFSPSASGSSSAYRLKECTNKAFPAGDVLGKQADELWELLAESTSFERRVTVAERFLSSMLTRASRRTRIMDTADHLIRSEPTSSISELARATGLSLRQYERRFVADIGLSPKLYARITRYQKALDLKLHRPERAWMSIAHETGYHDQMHMIKDFQLLNGAPPLSVFLRNLVTLGHRPKCP